MSPNANQYPGLPFRRLKQMANGIWDETRQAFYPFRAITGTSGSFAGKNGVHYYVKTVMITATNWGAHPAATQSYVYSVVFGVNAYLAGVCLPITAADVPVSQTVSVDVGVLCDMGAGLSFVMGADNGLRVVIYAEIPGDEGPVQVIN